MFWRRADTLLVKDVWQYPYTTAGIHQVRRLEEPSFRFMLAVTMSSMKLKNLHSPYMEELRAWPAERVTRNPATPDNLEYPFSR